MTVCCPRCLPDDEVTWQLLPDRMIAYQCAARHGGEGPYDWAHGETTVPMENLALTGLTEELLEPLSACVEPGRPFRGAVG